MKIDPTQTHDLLQRMREAARAVETDASATSIGGAGSADQAAVVSDDATPLESNLRATAERALRGEFADAAQLRGEVVEQILRDRWEGRVDADRVAEMVEELTPTLVDDPEFKRQVDEMLVLAARNLSGR